jgi:hypothetical protein
MAGLVDRQQLMDDWRRDLERIRYGLRPDPRPPCPRSWERRHNRIKHEGDDDDDNAETD